jgi:hypothetical protein
MVCSFICIASSVFLTKLCHCNADEVLSYAPMSSYGIIDATKHVPTRMLDKRLREHLKYHREKLFGVDTLANATLRYVSEMYPYGDMFATDCTRTAMAVLSFLTGSIDSLREDVTQGKKSLFHNCPDISIPTTTPTLHYVSLTGPHDDIFDISAGHRFIIIQAKGHARVLHAFKDQFSLGEYMHKTSSLSGDEFKQWWTDFKKTLLESDCIQRARRFEMLLGVTSFSEDVTHSWIYSCNINTN